MDEFTTLGISFFLALPSAINNLDAFEQMLGVAQDIRDTLDGDLKDDHRNGMTAQTIEHYRQRIVMLCLARWMRPWLSTWTIMTTTPRVSIRKQ